MFDTKDIKKTLTFYSGITCLDECFFCKISWEKDQNIQITDSELYLCDMHMEIVKNHAYIFELPKGKT